jgi:predicted Ser/Thr protein kinase
MSLASGSHLGPYEILALIGAGGMGEVYRARDSRLGRDVALKILPDAGDNDDPARRRRFEREARAVAALNHPNIVAIYDVGDGYIVSELVDGEPIRGVRPGVRKTVDIGVQIAAGLAAAHDAGIVHRDLKPENILLTKDGRVKILDFGLAKMTQPVSTETTSTVTINTEPGVVMGTVGYMAPEQVRGLASDHRADIFAFGVILYELLSGRRPFQGGTPVETMTAILRQETPELPERVPVPLREIVAHCLVKEPAGRFQSARDLGFALAQSVTRSGGAAIIKPRGNWSWPVTALACAAAGLAVGVNLLHAPAETWKGTELGGPEFAIGPRISPDGRMLAFQAMVAENTQVAVMKPESGNWQVLTHKAGAGSVDEIAWSPDGNRLYYDRSADVPMGVYSVPVLGGDEQLILEDAMHPAPLPDGSLLALKLNAERQCQLFRYWPDSGRLQWLPLFFDYSATYVVLRVLPNGKEAIGLARTTGPGDQAVHLYAVEIASGKVRRVETGLAVESITSLAATPDNDKILIATRSGDLTRLVTASRLGGRPSRALFTLSQATRSLDMAGTGSIFADVPDLRVSVARFSPGGGRTRIAPAGNARLATIAPLADGRIVVDQIAAGRHRLVVLEPGKDPVPLIITNEETAGPVTGLGAHEIAFLIGGEPWRTIAVASSSNRRVTRRIPFDKGPITSLAASPNGATIYCAAGGSIWAIPPSGEPRRICAGEGAAADPDGRSLLVKVMEAPKTRLVRVPLDGSAAREIPLDGQFHLTFDPLNAAAISRDDRLLVPLTSLDSWFFVPGTIDLATGRVHRIAVDQFGDYHSMAWMPDGEAAAVVAGLHDSIWKFTPEGR